MGTPRAVHFNGTVYLALLDANRAKVGGFVKAGNAYPLSLQVETEQKAMTSAMRENAGQTLHASTRITGIKGSMTLREIIAKTFAWVLSGTASAMSGSSGSLTSEAITAVLDEYVELSKKNVSTVVVKDVTDTTTYVAGTDYNVNLALGMIEAITGGAISDSDVLHVSADYAAETGNQIDVGSSTLIRAAMKIDGVNEVDNQPVAGEFDSVVLGTSAEIGLISDPSTDFEEFPFALTFETLSGQSSPGTISGILD